MQVKAGFNSRGFCAPVKTRVLEALDFDVCDRALSARFKSMAGRDLVHSTSGLVTVSIGGCSVLWRQHWQLLRLPHSLDSIEPVIQPSRGCTSRTTLSRYMGRLCAGRSVGGPYNAAGLSLSAKFISSLHCTRLTCVLNSHPTTLSSRPVACCPCSCFYSSILHYT